MMHPATEYINPWLLSGQFFSFNLQYSQQYNHVLALAYTITV